jgi:predicted HNH restriction endonuclease
MKKLIILLSITFLVNINASNAQTKTANKLGTSSRLSHNDSLMCNKTWQISAVEENGVVAEPTEKTENDMLMMKIDGTFNAILLGKKKAGTWSRSGQFIYFLEDSGEKFSYKIMTVEKKKIKVDYKNPDETHSIFIMKAK